ncbi:MAG: GTPase [Paludibacteraceae bacterium]|jgi:predicted GTPase|nr:GTPase [Paludibacteraceae bacterium]
MENQKLKSVEDLIDKNTDLPSNVKVQLKENIKKLASQEMNIMVTGATGCGKSSTINALFDTEKAQVGVGVNPETMAIGRYDFDNLIIWDTPGLGDGVEADKQHTENIIKKLHEKDSNGNLLIDLVLVILDASSRDLGTSYDLINNVIIPNLGDNKEGRILVALNQCDMAMKGRYWDNETHMPEQQLVDFLEDKVASVRNRIYNSTQVDVDPIYYSAGFKEPGKPQETSFNVNKLLYYIISKAPKEKRVIVYHRTNQSNLKKDKTLSSERDYRGETKEVVEKSAWESVVSGVAGGAAIGASLGGPVGGVIGGFIGGIVGLLF